MSTKMILGSVGQRAVASTMAGTNRSGVEAPQGVDALSDELLLRVFALLGPEAVLARAAAVCRRWRRLAVDPRLWSRVCIAYEEATDKPWRPETRPGGDTLWLRVQGRKRCVELHRALRRVPCLRRLQCSLRLRPPAAVLDAIAAAVRVPMQSLAVFQVPTDAVLPLLEAHAATLRSLEWRMTEKDFSWSSIQRQGVHPFMIARRERAMWASLAAMPLEELVVDWTWPSKSFMWMGMGSGRDPEHDGYFLREDHEGEGETAGPSTASARFADAPSWRLTKFHLMGQDNENVVLSWHRDFVWPGLAAGVTTLREISLRFAPVLLPQVTQCRDLRAVTLPVVKDLHLLAQCTQLRRVHLLGDEILCTYMDVGWGPQRRSVQFLKECARRGVPQLTELILEGFNKNSSQALPDSVGRLPTLQQLSFLRCEIRACDGTWFLLARAVAKLTALRKLVVGYASSIPRGGLARLGAALPPSVQFLRLDGAEGPWSFEDGVDAEADLRRVVAGRPGLHGCMTAPNFCGDRCEQVHGGLCGSRLLVNHGAHKPRRRDDCPLCAPALRYKGSKVEEVAAAAAGAAGAAAFEDTDDEDPDDDLEEMDLASEDGEVEADPAGTSKKRRKME